MARDKRTIAKRAERIASFYMQMDQFERELLQSAFDNANGDERAAAATLGLTVTAFTLKCERLGVSASVRRVAVPKLTW